MQQSARYKVNYPSANRSDSADVPRDFASVVAGLETSAMYGQGTLASRPTSSVGTPGIQGRFYMATDQTPHILYYDYGTGWDTVGFVANGGIGTAQLADASVTEQKLAAGVGGGDYGTSFPVSGLYNGYQFKLFWTFNGDTMVGNFIYRSDLDGTHPWQCQGGQWGRISLSGGSTNSTSNVHINGVVLPGFSGTWDLDIRHEGIHGQQSNAPTAISEVYVAGSFVNSFSSSSGPAGGSMQQGSFTYRGSIGASQSLDFYLRASAVSGDGSSVSIDGMLVQCRPFKL